MMMLDSYLRTMALEQLERMKHLDEHSRLKVFEIDRSYYSKEL
jgi:hypothetical protein